MTHLPYIAGAYGLFIAITAWLGINAALRLKTAAKRLAAIDIRARP